MLRIGFESEHPGRKQKQLSRNWEHPGGDSEQKEWDWEHLGLDWEHLRNKMLPIGVVLLPIGRLERLRKVKMLQQFRGLQHPPEILSWMRPDSEHPRSIVRIPR